MQWFYGDVNTAGGAFVDMQRGLSARRCMYPGIVLKYPMIAHLPFCETCFCNNAKNGSHSHN